MEGFGSSYYHDRYTHRPAVVHLRLCEGGLPSASSPTPRGTGELEEEAFAETAATGGLNQSQFLCEYSSVFYLSSQTDRAGLQTFKS